MTPPDEDGVSIAGVEGWVALPIELTGRPLRKHIREQLPMATARTVSYLAKRTEALVVQAQATGESEVLGAPWQRLLPRKT